jgi:hypothetical protein
MALLLEDYFLDVQNTVRTRAVADGSFTQPAFTHEMADRLSVADEVDSLSVYSLETTGSRNRRIAVDGVGIDDEENQVVLVISDHRSSDEIETLTTTEAKRHFGALQAFLETAMDGSYSSRFDPSSPAYADAESIHELRARGELDKVRLYLLSNAQLSDSIRSFPSEKHGGVEVEFHIWGIERFHRVELSQLGREELDIDLTEWVADGLPALPASSAGSGVDTFLVVIPGELLANIYERFGSRVLESNVRAFLTNRGKVNKGIQGTLLQAPELFLPYNNGITATASAITTSPSAGTLAITAIRDLQIVNGGQTTASLYFARRNEKVDLRDAFVQMKLIVVDHDRIEELVPKISRWANTQNKVSESDFFSNHPFHQRMEEKSRLLRTPTRAGEHHETKWFYERSRGQYLSEKNKLSTRDAKKFALEYPKEQVIDKTLAARYLNSWDQQPHIVSSGLQRNFMLFANSVSSAWEKSDLVFDDYYFRALVGKAILFETLQSAVSKSDWYRANQGYRLNIITYTVARFALAVAESDAGAEMDFDKLWELQAIPEDLVEELVALAEDVREVLVDPGRPVTNVTEWAKRPACWEAVKAVPFDLPPEYSHLLRSGDDVRDARRSGRKAQRVDSEINAQVEVVNLGQKYWINLRNFGRRTKQLSDTDLSFISYATGEKGQIPSEKQCKRLLEIRERMVESGFVGR